MSEPHAQESRARDPSSLHLVTVGMSPRLVANLWDRIAPRCGFRISHIAHPSFDRRSWSAGAADNHVHFIRERLSERLPPPDRDLLASLEQDGVPTIHSVLMSDRFLARLPYDEGLSYATLVARRLMALYRETNPAAIVGDFDGLHGSLACLVAKHLRIPWFAMYFSSLPSGRVALCSDLSPASMVVLGDRDRTELRADAERLLREFAERKVQAAAYVPPDLLSASFVVRQVPAQLRTVLRVLGRRGSRSQLKYTDYATSYSLAAKFREVLRVRRNLWKMKRAGLATRPAGRSAFFGLHMQPESSIDVHAHFFSNQMRVVELMARSLPPTHTLYVKLHKSDASNYSPALIAQLARFPGVRVVSPFADTIEFIRSAELIFSIQGTIGLEAAMLGKPVIMFGDSPMRVFPNVTTFARTVDLPSLVRQKLAERPPDREALVEGLSSFLEWFHPASINDWNLVPSPNQIDGYVELFRLLGRYIEERRGR